MKYKVRIEKTEEGYAVWCPGLLGCWSQGDTEEEALENIKDAIQMYLETADELLKDHHHPSPRRPHQRLYNGRDNQRFRLDHRGVQEAPLGCLSTLPGWRPSRRGQKLSTMSSEIHLGTQGFSFDDWVGPFYPPGTPKTDFERFDRIQIDRSKEQTQWAERVRGFLDRGIEVWAYFNNHWAGHSPASARQFAELLGVEVGGPSD